ncbi:hypothetical protein K469DRAFT_710497 [Zopfia rhizophila CBS 207.26]|uniref:Uncharacterized protein n=1 Tax=Zopfia rhizophila CBS 207.26 TaxID=1314779 RepID=A0A6A6DXE1_9PEZI|nr:hypothetical protein K469DRAFT_710497 [Zopfia rhizophila CBS 207.26]
MWGTEKIQELVLSSAVLETMQYWLKKFFANKDFLANASRIRRVDVYNQATAQFYAGGWELYKNVVKEEGSTANEPKSTDAMWKECKNENPSAEMSHGRVQFSVIKEIVIRSMKPNSMVTAKLYFPDFGNNYITTHCQCTFNFLRHAYEDMRASPIGQFAQIFLDVNEIELPAPDLASNTNAPPFLHGKKSVPKKGKIVTANSLLNHPSRLLGAAPNPPATKHELRSPGTSPERKRFASTPSANIQGMEKPGDNSKITNSSPVPSRVQGRYEFSLGSSTDLSLVVRSSKMELRNLLNDDVDFSPSVRGPGSNRIAGHVHSPYVFSLPPGLPVLIADI